MDPFHVSSGGTTPDGSGLAPRNGLVGFLPPFIASPRLNLSGEPRSQRSNLVCGALAFLLDKYVTICYFTSRPNSVDLSPMQPLQFLSTVRG